MAFDLTNLTANDTNILDFAQVTNDAAEGVPFAGLVLALFVIQTVAISSRSQVGIAGSGTLSAWLCFIYSLFLSMAGLLNFFFVIGFLTLAGFGALYLYLEGK